MWSSTAIPSPRNFQSALVSGPELQALLHPARADHDAQDLRHQVQQSPTAWPAQPPQDLGLNANNNLILSALSAAELAALAPHLERVTLASGQVMGQPGHSMAHVYFPLSCSVSWVSHTADGESAELALVGSDGLVGVPLVLGGLAMQHTVQVQCGGQALRMGADVFLRLLGTQVRLHKLALLYAQWQMTQLAQSIVCSRHHAVSERLSHWLLSHAQAAKRCELHVTHETIAHMLGVRRESVTQAAGRFQAAGWLGNSRGKITLKDTQSLSRMACECHARSQAESQRYVHQLARLAQTPHGDGHASSAGMAGNGAATSMSAADAGLPLSSVLSPELPPYGLSPAQATPPHTGDDLQKYVDAYDFAPVGFVTLDAQGQILQTNLAGAILLDIQRSQCQHQRFSDFLDGESQAPFARFHNEVLGGQCRRHCVVQLTAAAHRSALRVRIDATADEWGVENRMVLIDVSEDTTSAGPQSGHWSFQSADAGTAPGAWPS
jgi:CRP-like cAMP-binding protein